MSMVARGEAVGSHRFVAMGKLSAGWSSLCYLKRLRLDFPRLSRSDS